MAIRNAKKILNLKHRKAREGEHKFVIEGIRLVDEALRSNADVEQLVFGREALSEDPQVKQLFQEANARGILIQQTDHRALKHMGENQSPEGVLGVVRMPNWNRSKSLASDAPLLLMDRIRDPGNLGLILRTAEAAGVSGVFLSSDSVELYNPKVVRASRGSIFRLPSFRHEDLAILLPTLREQNVTILSAQLDGTPFNDVTLEGRFAILLGNETFGVDPALSALSNQPVTIPMAEGVNSLNVAVAAGILLFRFRPTQK
ncbi:MAG: RNA methyltransferase [bacterium]|nr:RNA methyltransferase [bacterium]